MNSIASRRQYGVLNVTAYLDRLYTGIFVVTIGSLAMSLEIEWYCTKYSGSEQFVMLLGNVTLIPVKLSIGDINSISRLPYLNSPANSVIKRECDN